MKYIDEFRNPQAVKEFIRAIHEKVTRPWQIMEICGGQTHSLLRYGIDDLLPDQVTLVHGPGCPVCVTPLEKIDKAIHIASQPNVIFCSFGDMLRVPGSRQDLLSAKAEGADVRIVYSPMDALELARKNPAREVVFFAVGFETTAPGIAMALHFALQENVENFSALISHVLVPPAMEAILSAPDNEIDGFLAAGHVCTVMGYEEYEPLAEKYRIPIVVTGFEPLDLVQGIYMCLSQLEAGEHRVENQYTRSVRREGNLAAKDLMRRVFTTIDQKWRGIGVIPRSGYGLQPEFKKFDAEEKFDIRDLQVDEPEECISGLVLQGKKKPYECPAFGTACTPEHPLGATMVSSEGACAAYYHYKKNVA